MAGGEGDSKKEPRIALSLCDGLGGLALSLKKLNGKRPFTRYVAVENNSTSRKVCQATNPEGSEFPGVEHGFNGKHDIDKITEEDIKPLPPNSIKLVSAGPECVDFSKLRLLPDRSDYHGKKKELALGVSFMGPRAHRGTSPIFLPSRNLKLTT